MKATLVALSLFVFLVLACGTSPALAVVGGWNNADTENKVIVELANFAIGELGKDYRLVKIKKAITQMDKVVNYHLKLDVERTTSAGKKRSYGCQVKLFDQPWAKKREMTEYHCINMD